MRASAEVLFVTSTLEVGGSETKIVRISNALARSGHAVAIAYLNPPDTLLEQVDPGVPVTHLGRRGKFSFASLGRLRRMVAERSNTLVLAVNYYPLLYVLPAVRWSHAGTRAACLVNTSDFVDGQWIWGHAYAPFLRRCDQLVFGCRSQQELWTSKYRLPRERSRYIYNGVDTTRFSPAVTAEGSAGFRAEHGIPPDAVVIGGMGRFAPEKNFDLLIEALSTLAAQGRPVYLVLLGQGAERPKLEAAAKRGLDGRARFPGVLKDVRSALAAMDAFVLPSRAVETFSNAALEAMAMARPVVLSRIGGAAEMIEDGESGFLFDSGDVQRLVEIVSGLYDSPGLRDRVGAAARQRVVDRFSFDRMIADYEALLL